MAGYITISDIKLKSPVMVKEDGKNPYAEASQKGAKTTNFVVYLNDDSLEKYYSSIDAYNHSASGFVSYSDLKQDYNFKIIGAFYINTKESDDNGYIFPYNVTEQQTPSSSLEFLKDCIIDLFIIQMFRLPGMIPLSLFPAQPLITKISGL